MYCHVKAPANRNFYFSGQASMSIALACSCNLSDLAEIIFNVNSGVQFSNANFNNDIHNINKFITSCYRNWVFFCFLNNISFRIDF